MVVAFILATTRTGKEKEVLESLRNMEGVNEAHNVYGDYDVFAKINADNINQLNEIMIQKIRDIPHIVTTSTLISV